MTNDPLAKFLSEEGSWEDPAIATVRCPTCGGPNQHFKEPVRILRSRDAYKVDWGGRGDLLVIPFFGECGSRWEVCFGFHEGDTGVFARIVERCGAESA